MDKKMIKRIIAREGLVICACLLLFMVFFFLQEIIPYNAPVAYRYEINTGGHSYIVESQELLYSFDQADKAELVKELRSKYPKDIEKSGSIIWIPEDLKIGPPKAKYTFLMHIRRLLNNLMVFFLMGAYPLYLLIRFVIWAVKTLREGK